MHSERRHNGPAGFVYFSLFFKTGREGLVYGVLGIPASRGRIGDGGIQKT